MGIEALGLGISFSARDLASDTLKRLQGTMKQTQSVAEQTARAVAGAWKQDTGKVMGRGGVAAPAAGNMTDAWAATKDMARTAMMPGRVMAGGLVAAAKEAGEFQGAITQVGLVSQASAADLKQLRDAAIKAGIDTQFAPKEAAGALENLASQGFNAKDSIQALIPALDLAAAGGLGVENAASAMTSAVKVFGLEVGDAGLAADKMLKIANATALAPKDLELALGTVGRGASLTKQTLDEMLPSMGLIKNTGVDASVAASSVSAALVHMAGASKEFKKLGVDVTDVKTGSFRPFMDILSETDAILSKKFPNSAERAAKAEKLFSRFGLTAYSAISSQLTKGVQDAEGKVYQGAQAVAFLRKEMATAGGTAAKFRETKLDSFLGQLKLLEGSVKTFKILAGEGLAAVFKPIVTVVLTAFNKLVDFMNRLNPEAKRTVGIIATAVTAVVALAGAGIAATAVFTILGPVLKGAAISFVTAMAPVLLVLGAAALIGAGVYVAFNKSGQAVDGFGNAVRDLASKASLAFEALSQLFSRGWLDSKTWGKLMNSENEGVLAFVKQVWLWGNRVLEFFRGAWRGFQTAISLETFERLGRALVELGMALGIVEKSDPNSAGQAFDRWGRAGEKLGKALAKIAETLTTVVTKAIELATPVVEGVRKVWKDLNEEIDKTRPLADKLADGLKNTNSELVKVQDTARSGQSDVEQAIRGLGGLAYWFGGVAAEIGRGFAGILGGVAIVLGNFWGLLTGIFTGQWGAVWTSLKGIAFGALNAVGQALISLLGILARTGDRLNQLRGVKSTYADQTDAMRRDFREGLMDTLNLKVGSNNQFYTPNASGLPPEVQRTKLLPEYKPIMNPEAGAAALGIPQTQIAATRNDYERTGMFDMLADALPERFSRLIDNRPIMLNANLLLDGEVLAKANVATTRKNDVESFKSLSFVEP